MSFVQQIADAISTAPARALDALSQSIWQGLQAGALTDDDAQRLAELIHVRRMAARAAEKPTDGRSGRRSPIEAATAVCARRCDRATPTARIQRTTAAVACLKVHGWRVGLSADHCRRVPGQG
jgi:hypothetical protein